MSDTPTPALENVLYKDDASTDTSATDTTTTTDTKAADTIATTATDDTATKTDTTTTDTKAATDDTKATDGDGLLTKDPDPKTEDGAKTDDPAPTYTVESYAELALPEGLTVDEPMFTKFKGIAAELGIAPDKAGSMLELQKEFQESQRALMEKAIVAQDQRWQAELSAIPELSGENRAKAQEVIGRAIAEFGSPEVREILTSYRLQNNPTLARFIYSMAHALVEDEADAPGGVAPVNPKTGRAINGKLSLEQALYGDEDNATTQ